MNKPGLRFIAINYSSQLVRFMENQGFSADEVLEGTGIPAQVLANPEGRISPRQHEALVARARRLMRDELLGLRFGRQMRLSAHGHLGLAIMSSATLHDAVQLLVRYFPTVTRLVRLEFVTDSHLGYLRVLPDHALPSAYRFVAENVMGGIVTTAEALSESTPSYVQCEFRGEPLTSVANYEQLLRYPARFHCEFDQLCFDLPFLQQSMPSFNPLSLQLAEQQCREQLQLIEQQPHIHERVASWLQRHMAPPSLEQAALELCMTSRTLNRHLARYGVTYKELADTQRKSRAEQLLRETNWSIDRIAEALGYGDPSNFNRAFRRWFGVAPSAYRQQDVMRDA
jgi:AraC-like DNA-binding protein